MGFQPRILDRLNACGHAVMDKSIHAARLFRRQVITDIEILDLAANLHGEGGNIETGNARNTRAAGENILPGLFDAIADRRDDPQAGDDNSTTCQIELRKR